MKRLEWLRCPVCGKLSRLRNFLWGVKQGHTVEIMVQTIGQKGKKGWGTKWVAKDLSVADTIELYKALVEILDSVKRRLTIVIKFLVGDYKWRREIRVREASRPTVKEVNKPIVTMSYPVANLFCVRIPPQVKLSFVPKVTVRRDG